MQSVNSMKIFLRSVIIIYKIVCASVLFLLSGIAPLIFFCVLHFNIFKSVLIHSKLIYIYSHLSIIPISFILPNSHYNFKLYVPYSIFYLLNSICAFSNKLRTVFNGSQAIFRNRTDQVFCKIPRTLKTLHL